ncbi:MAG: acetyl-CoA carboxylase carboxyltransferase subunit alpha [Thermodesulfovibrio sp.]|nr:acetyl-CoA carboxylase carboxyltransferase subunit alpha [Thermodesulfovibrio sp.]MCX7724202.1 acetyl-CoA carboxylase carboxyltransferase subunit alpha [Thermodesulfovibrio sp.]MDW7972633.1 acetyl-CoA carboxylase carboxyltransferase subunit alpha [Thermodesulfovibrio sp.]
MTYYLDFEKPIQELEIKIEELKKLSDDSDIDLTQEIKRLNKKLKELKNEIFSNLTPWQKTQIARHPERPYTLDYISMIFEDFIELHGDRRFGDDPAIIAGVGKIEGISYAVVGHQKGRTIKERIHRNFGQAHPEGYRKALRIMKLAERFSIPVITMIDTPGAFPGIGAEERGQAEAIATNLMEMSLIKTPLIGFVIGEGGSGGALALSVCDRIFMLEHAIYSVISPEGCAAILWKKDTEVGVEEYAKAAEQLKVTAQDLKKFGIIDDIIPEPLGGAHRDPQEVGKKIKAKILSVTQELIKIPSEELIKKRYEKFRKIGNFWSSLDRRK